MHACKLGGVENVKGRKHVFIALERNILVGMVIFHLNALLLTKPWMNMIKR